MHIKNILFWILFVVVMSLQGQNVINQYDFASISQAILSNPSYDLQTKYHVVIPGFDNSISAGSSGITLYDVFSDNNIPIEIKLKEAIYDMSSNDVFLINQKNELFNIGYKVKQDTYLSFGFYEELDVYSNFPKSLSEFFYEGTTQIGKRYTINDYAFQADLLGVYHFGIQKKIDEQTSIGIRFKLYSSVFNAKTSHNKGDFYTELGETNIYRQGINGMNLNFKSSGIVLDDYEIIDKKYVLDRLFFKGSLGIGVDLGLTYYKDENITISGSLTDLGVIFQSKDVANYFVEGNYVTEGIALEFDSDNPVDYWSELENDFDEKVSYTEDNDMYISWRPTQLNTFIKYSFGKKRYADCTYDSDLRNTDIKKNSFGALLQLQKRPSVILPSLSVFYEKNINNVLQARFSYTADKFSQANFGAALSLQVWKVNLFAGVNDIIGLANLAKANSTALQFGLNINSN